MRFAIRSHPFFHSHSPFSLFHIIAADISPEELQPLPSDETTVEPVPDFLPSDNEDEDEDRPDEVDDSTSAPYVPPHMPRFPSRHSFKQTPVSPIPKKQHNFL